MNDLGELLVKLATGKTLTPREIDFLRLEGRRTQMFNALTAGFTDNGLSEPHFPTKDSVRLANIFSVGARVLRTTAGGGASQSIDNDTDTIITFNTEDYDDAHFYDTAAPTRLTIPDGLAGTYLIGVGCFWGVDADGYRRFNISKNGVAGFSPLDERGAVGVIAMGQSAVHERTLSAGDYLELNVKHTAGAALDCTNPYMWIRKMR
jgi:hypothetical protein